MWISRWYFSSFASIFYSWVSYFVFYLAHYKDDFIWNRFRNVVSLNHPRTRVLCVSFFSPINCHRYQYFFFIVHDRNNWLRFGFSNNQSPRSIWTINNFYVISIDGCMLNRPKTWILLQPNKSTGFRYSGHFFSLLSRQSHLLFAQKISVIQLNRFYSI